MTPALHRFGESRSPVVVVDDITGTHREAIELAAALAPFPSAEGTYYPGARRVIAQSDAANAYVERLIAAASPFIGGAFDFDGFDLLEASFSLVTAPPKALSPAQRAPHFDSRDPDYVALLHYLSDTPGTGTAFYRQRSTGIEVVTEANVDRFIATAKRESTGLEGYTNETNAFFEQIGAVEAAPDRLVIYQGCLLHSGIIPPDMDFSADPRRGRLTANLFIRGYTSGA